MEHNKLKHEDIWAGIDRLASAFGYSPSGLAKKAGLDPTSFNKSKRTSPDGKPRWPSTESLSKVLAATDATMSDFIELLGQDLSSSLTPAPLSKETIARETAKALIKTKSVLFNAREPFTYSSGNTGPVYVDIRRLMSFVKERSQLMDFAAQLLSDEIGAQNLDYIAGGETAGIPFAAFIAERMEKPMIYVRKKPKGHGRSTQIEGHFESGNVLLVEDLQNFGANKDVFIEALRSADAKVEHFFSLFDYGIRSEVKAINDKMGLTTHHLCNWWDVLDIAKENKCFDSEALISVEEFLNDPSKWSA